MAWLASQTSPLGLLIGAILVGGPALAMDGRLAAGGDFRARSRLPWWAAMLVGGASGALLLAMGWR